MKHIYNNDNKNNGHCLLDLIALLWQATEWEWRRSKEGQNKK